MRMTTLSARHVQNPGANRQGENVEQTRDFAPVAFGSKEWLVLEEVVGVKRGFPPLATLFQKNTGSR